MGLFLDNYKNYDKYVENRTTSTNNCQNVGVNNCGFNFGELTVSLATQGSSLFFQYWDSEGRGGSDDKALDPETQEKVDAKQKELEGICSSHNVKSRKELSKTAKNTTKEFDKQTKELEGLNQKLTTLNSDLTTLNTEYSRVSGEIKSIEQYSETKKDDPSYNNRLSVLKEKLQNLEDQIEKKKSEIANVSKDINEKQGKLNTANIELVQLNTDLGRAENIEQEILKLKGEKLSKEVKYDVEQETEDIKTFMSALTAFKENPNAETAKSLKEAYEGDGTNTESGIQQKSVQKAYSMVSAKVETLLNKQKAA